jgi:hypothetical protein
MGNSPSLSSAGRQEYLSEGVKMVWADIDAMLLEGKGEGIEQAKAFIASLPRELIKQKSRGGGYDPFGDREGRHSCLLSKRELHVAGSHG